MQRLPKHRSQKVSPITYRQTQLPLVALLAALGAWSIGCGGGGSPPNEYRVSVNRLKAVDLGLLEYVSDYDDVLPPNDRWMDGLTPYTKDESLFRSPAVSAKGYGYAMNTAISGKNLPFFPDTSVVVSLFDSTDLARNATAPLSTEPSPARYSGRNTIAYLDGHVNDETTVNPNPPTLYQQSQTRLKSVSLGVVMYSSDYDEVLPLTNQWVDELMPYVKSDLPFHSPAMQIKNAANYGYALNSAVAGQSVANIASPATTLSVFDSTVLSKNATAAISTLPNPPRYGKFNTLAYVDGHIQK